MIITFGFKKDGTRIKIKYFLYIFSLWVNHKKVNTLSSVESEVNSELEER